MIKKLFEFILLCIVWLKILFKTKRIPKIKREVQAGYLPDYGCDWNPVIKYPRNASCWCGSGKKAKKCCLPFEPIAIRKKFAQSAKPLIKIMRNEASKC